MFVWADRGELVLTESAVRSSKQYTELARKRVRLPSDVWPDIVLSDGHLYCKDRNGDLKCFQTQSPPR